MKKPRYRNLRQGLGDRASAFVRNWSLPRQLAGQSVQSKAAESETSRGLRPRLEQADTVGTSVCPFCAVGCGQLIYAKGGKPLHIEGDPRSPVNQGTLCPKGASTLDNEENYLIKKLFSGGLGLVNVENQARI